MPPFAPTARILGGLAVVLAALAGSPAIPREASGPATPLKSLHNPFLEVTIHADSSTVIRDLARERTGELGPVAILQKGWAETGQVWLADTEPGGYLILGARSEVR